MVRVRLILAVAFLLAFVGVAQADNAYMPVAQGTGGRFSGFGSIPPLKTEIEQVYVQQTLNAHYVLGWNRGPQWDSYVDWTMGREYTFRPWDWDSGVWRDAWAQTPGQRFAHWWVGYCVSNCDNYVCDLSEGPCADIEAQLAADFDIALSSVTAR